MSQDQLDLVIGNGETLLPESGGSEPLYVWSCWETPPKGFDEMIKRIAPRLFGFRSEVDLRAEFLCQHRERKETGTVKALDAP